MKIGCVETGGFVRQLRWLLLGALLMVLGAGCVKYPVSQTRSMMTTEISITVYAHDGSIRGDYIFFVIEDAFKEVERVEKLAQRERLTELNFLAGKGQAYVPVELYELIERSYRINRLTDGAFSPDMGPIKKLWNIGTEDARLPHYLEVRDAMEIVENTNFSMLDSALGYLEPAGAALDLGAVAKGYAVDRACEVLKENGVTAAMVWAGGDLRVFGSKPDASLWKIAVRHPRDPEEFISVVSIAEGAVATSGDYERYSEFNGGRYHHIFNPSDGYPSRASISSTVIAKTCLEADAFATAFFVLGPEKGCRKAEKLGYPAMVIAERGDELVIKKATNFERFEVDSAE